MLEAYKRMQQNGVIGPMMKVDPQGQPIIDMDGSKPGSLVARPGLEYPKLLRRLKADGTIKHIEVFSRSDELKALAENPDSDVPRSPLERERDELANEVATERKMNNALATQLENALARIEQLTARMDKVDASAPKNVEHANEPGELSPKAADAFAHLKPTAASAEAKAIANKA